jgi:hypothetical protein
MIKIRSAITSVLKLGVLMSILAIVVVIGEDTHVSSAETQTSSTTCSGDSCHSVVCLNGICHASNTNSTKITQNSTMP